MNKQELIEKLQNLHLDEDEYWLVAGSAMLMHGLRKETNDIDLGCTTKLANELQILGYPTNYLKDGSRHITLGEDVEIFEDYLMDGLVQIEGFHVVSIKGILEMKRQLNREKDQQDIAILEAYLLGQNEMYQRLHSGRLYLYTDEEIMKVQTQCVDLLYDYNHTRPTEQEKRDRLLKEMFAEVGVGCYVEPPLRCNWGGHHIHFGNYVYANFNLTCVDDTHIYVGDYTLIGPNVTISPTGHPIQPELRKQGYQFGIPVHIGKNCWIGAGVIILPGVTIGDNTIIGAGSVVTKDIPSGVVAFGNPCRVIREVNEHDDKYYYKNREIDV